MARTEPYVSAPPGAADLPYQGIGAELRAAREAAAQSADLVASTLRIRRPHIQAIEEGRFQDLPGQVYAIGFIRAYAEYLHLDGDLVVERFREEADGPSPKLELHFPEPATRRSRLDLRALLVGLIIAVGAYGTWNYVQTRGQLPRELVAMVPANLLVASAENAVTGMPAAAPAETSAPSSTDAPEGSLSSGLRSAITAVETRRAADDDFGLNDASDRANSASTTVTAEDSMRAASTAPMITALRAPERVVSDAEGESTDIADVPRVLRAGDNLPASQPSGTETVQRLSSNRIETEPDSGSSVELEIEPVPSEDAIGRLVVAGLEAGVDPVVSTESDSELPPLSDTVDGFRLGETDGNEPGSAVPITGALAETPEAPTLLENALPLVPMAPSAEYEPRVYGQGNIDARVVVRARIESWVQVEGSNNELLLTRVLKPGDTFRVPNRADLSLVTGNAGGIEILVDGVLMPPLGPEGTVRRNVPLSPDALTGADTVSSR